MEHAESFLNALTKAPRILAATTDEWRGGILWECSIHWVYKLKWGGKRYRIPFKKKVVDAVKPHGEAMFRIFNLCEQCHPFQKYGYASGLNWFCHVVHIDLIPQSYSHARPKTDRVSDGRDEIKKLRERENPFSENDELHLWRVVDCSIKKMQAEPGLLFETDYWRPFVKGYTVWLSALESPDWKSVEVDGDAIRYRPGRGHGTIKIDVYKDANQEKVFHNGEN